MTSKCDVIAAYEAPSDRAPNDQINLRRPDAGKRTMLPDGKQATRPASKRNNPEPLPILVGLSGKRDLQGREAALTNSLLSAFESLDKAFPHSSKVLITGMAEGADELASEVALKRPSWRVYGLLPLPQQNYAATMASGAASSKLAELLGHPRTRHSELQRLALPVPSARPPEISGFSDTSLHYEQLGLWLAEYATVLLAILPADEEPKRPGGTARVIMRRLQGAPDAIGRAVIGVSSELANRPVLDPPDRQPVWRIDLAGIPENGMLPSAIIEQIKTDSNPILHKVSHLAKWFPLAADIDKYNRLAGALPIADWPTAKPEANSLLVSYRRLLSSIQGTFQSYWKRCIWGLSIAFILAVVLFEAFAKLTADFGFVAAINLNRWSMPAYTLIVTSAFGLYALAAWRRWQLLHEDYRAINEVLRVQLAWWRAGLMTPADRADNHYLIGAEPSLAHVRRGATAAITWIRLIATTPEENWDEVHGKPESYVDAQEHYFHRRSIEREQAVYVTGVSSWFCFALGFGVAVWLALYGVQDDWMLGPIAHEIDEQTGHAPAQFAWMLAGCAYVVRLLSPTNRLSSLQTGLPGVLIGCFAVAFGMYDLGRFSAPTLATGGKAMVLITMVTLLAVAGALRFLADKLAWEAEALAYHEANARFSYGLGLLGDIDNANISPPEKRQRKQVVIRELGLKALAENESWLRAHRERPIEPVVGA